MCKVFPSSLGCVVMRWFDGLGVSSIDSFKELTRAFRSRFITCRKVPRLLDSLLSMTMREWETLKTYSNRDWEMFNEIDCDFDDVAIWTFNVCLLAEHGLRRTLTRKGNVIPHERRDFKLDRYNNNRPQRDFARQLGSTTPQMVKTVFREPVHQVLEKIKNEP